MLESASVGLRARGVPPVRARGSCMKLREKHRTRTEPFLAAACRAPSQGNATNGSASHTTVHMQLPNPQNYNQTSIYYDPTSTTTSAYLATTDTSNIDVSSLVATTQSATDTSATSSSSSTSSGLSDGAKIGIIAGCAVGGAFLIAGAVVAAVVAKRRREGFNKVVALGPESA